jgi:hypothetical protein
MPKTKAAHGNVAPSTKKRKAQSSDGKKERLIEAKGKKR